MARKGMGYGTGKGYKNIIGKDKKVHSDSAQGKKQPQNVNVIAPIQKPENRDEYSGWTNKETWAVKLWWDNSQGDQEHFSEEANEFRKEGKAVHEFADQLKSEYEEMEESVFDGNGTKQAKDMVKDVGSSWRVNWVEIAKAYYEESESNEKYNQSKN
jgi:hypothetical protein